MISRFALAGCIILSLAFLTPDLFACEACQTILNFTDTAQKSDLIVIATKVNDSGKTGAAAQADKPDWIEIKVSNVIKGKPPKDIIRVNSWDGMCNYGITLEDGASYIVFLARRINATCDHCEYDAVEYGCAVKAYLTENDKVYKDKEWIPLSDFVKSLPLLNSRSER